MTTQQPSSPRFTRSSGLTKALGLALVLAVIAFMLSPNAPLGSFWAPGHDVPQPTAGQLPLLVALNAAEVLAFGLGVSFLIYGYPAMQRIGNASPGLTRAAHLSIAWLLINWWPHDSLHIHNGLELNGLIGIEYAFHVTLIIAGFVLAAFFLRLQSPARG